MIVEPAAATRPLSSILSHAGQGALVDRGSPSEHLAVGQAAVDPLTIVGDNRGDVRVWGAFM